MAISLLDYQTLKRQETGYETQSKMASRFTAK